MMPAFYVLRRYLTETDDRQLRIYAGGTGRVQRRAPEVSMLIREAFLRGISTCQVGRVVVIVIGKTVSAQTVSRLTRDLDEAVQQFHEAPLSNDLAYLFLDGVNLNVRANVAVNASKC